MQIINKTKNILLLFLILYSFLHQAFCTDNCVCENLEEPACNDCNQNCKFYNDKCITCPDLQTKPYFKMSTGENSQITCTTIKNKNENDYNIIIKYDTKEIINRDSCGDSSSSSIIEDICYTNSYLSGKGITTDGKCESTKYKYITIKDGFKYINCDSQCPTNYKYYNVEIVDGNQYKECSNTNCPSNKWMKRESIGGRNIIRCSVDCISSSSSETPTQEYKYYYQEDSSSPKIQYCVDKCPNEAKFYYESAIENEVNSFECLDKCLVRHFSEGDICKDTCANYITVNLNKNIYACLDVNSCNSDYPYLYKVSVSGGTSINYCLKSCQDTNNNYFGDNKKLTYIFVDENGGKECLDQKADYKIDTIALKWVDECKNAYSGPYTYTDNGNEIHKCVQECPAKYEFDTLNCISNCAGDYQKYYIESNACYKDCPSNLGKSFIKYDSDNNNNNECQSCDVPKGETLSYGEGYYIPGDENNKCYPSCEVASTSTSSITYYHNDGDNICSNTECKDRNLYKYKPSDLNVCYKSCEDIQSLGYKYEKNFICYKIKEDVPAEDNEFFYKSSSGIIKYTTDDKDCFEAGYQYIDYSTKECVKQCNSNFYRKLPTNDKIGVCFTSSEGSGGFPGECKYYNKTNKICTEECAFFEIKDTYYINQNKENCVIQCPGDYFEKGNECATTCSETNDIIIEESNKKKCVQNCDKFLQEISGQKYCVDKCKKTIGGNIQYLNYIIDANGKQICKDSCSSETNDIYSLSTKDDHQLCISTCPTTHPYTKGQFCLSECDYYSNNNCVDNCNSNKYIHPGNICSDNVCPSNAPFYYSQSVSEDNSVTVKKCVPNCKEYESKYSYYKIIKTCDSSDPQVCTEEKECVQVCDPAGEKYNYEGRCYDKCPDGLYYDQNSNCVSKCEPNFFEEVTEGDGESQSKKYVCLSQRPTGDGVKKYLRSSGECVSVCPAGEIFVGTDNKCLSSCKEDGKEFYEKIGETNNYQCVSNCNGKVHLEGEKECKASCDNLSEYEYNGVCYKSCLTINKFSIVDTNDGDKKKCSDRCIGDAQYFEEDKICRDECKSLSINKIINDTEEYQYKYCVSKCDLNSKYKYLNTINDIYYCRTSCDFSNGQIRYLKSNYICSGLCSEPNNFIVEDPSHPNVALECLSQCPPDKPYARKNSDNEFICSNEECGKNQDDEPKKQQFYYLNDSKCIEKCDTNDYNIKGTNICKTSCVSYDSKKLYYYEPDGGSKYCVFNCLNNEDNFKFTDLNNKCSTGCGENDFYDENDKICRIKCPAGKVIDGQFCRDSCDSSPDNKYENETGYCVSNCSSSQSNYIYNRGNKCANNCSDLYIEYNECKQTCSDDNPYMYEKNCVPICPLVKRFFVSNNKTCLTDCPKEYPFYTISSDENPKYECTDNCKAYIPSQNSNVNAQKCFGDDCDINDFPLFIYDFKNSTDDYRKKCLVKCPSSRPFIHEKECLTECPGDMVHLVDEFECKSMSDCSYGFIKYNSKECVEKCSKNDKIYEITLTTTDGDKKIYLCVDNCTVAEDYLGANRPENGLKLTYDNKCVSDCPEFSESEGKFCVCRRLFYINKSTGYKTCLNPDLTLCESKTDYPIIKMNQDECTDYCDGVLSLSGFECYNSSYTCEKNQTLTTLINGNKKCECKNKYYHVTENNRKIRKCLAEKEECPSSYPYLIKETNECIKKCSDDEKYKIILGKTCVETCPTSTHEEGEDIKECKCNNKWYISDNNDVICIKDDGECPSDKELYVESTKQCVSSCIGTDSEVYYKKTCIQSCGNMTTLEDSRKEPKLKSISKNFCKCNYLWYYDINGYEVCKERGEDKTCKNLGDEGYSFKYVIDSINQCTNKIPDEYPYLFDDRCISSCTSAGLIIDNEESRTCKCPNLWRYGQNNKMECLNENQCGENELLIYSTKQCLLSCSGEDCTPECPKESPLLYQNTCYKSNECPKNTKYDEINQKCACEFKWYIDDNGLEYCLTNNTDCPDGYPYVFYETNECKKEKGNDLFEVNNTLYKYCPENTTPNNGLKECECDPLAGYWYKKTENGKTITVCGLNECSGNYPYHNFQEKECYPLCNDNYFLYENTCYNEKCPNLTEIIPGTKECKLKEVDTEIKLNDLEKVMTDNIVDLYQRSSEASGTNKGSGAVASASKKIVTTGATVEFYGVNKNNRGNSHQDVKSDLSYIDISECIEKIYKSNNMNEKEDDIIILKFDVNREFQNYLITPVEYKFINSRTGRELDASVCEHNSIRISYPVHNLINKYDKMRKKLRLLEYMKVNLMSNNKDSLREKFDKGIDIIADYPDTDIFNINDKFYSDICIAVEVNGKDLVLEDRIKFFYPQLSLCENNCTYNRTDFTNERIHCDCSYKTEFDFERKYTDSFELNANETTKNQKSKSNIEVLKCISNLNDSKSLSKNGGFIYSLIIMIVEAIILLVIILIGIHSLSLKLTNKINKTDENPEKIEVNVINTNDNKKTYEDIKSSERNIDNPPKKKVGDFKIEFIPQEYVFLFFNHGEKGVVKKVEKDSVPFKIQYNTRVLLEQKKGVNYDNINPRGPFPPGQNVLVVVDSMDDDINDYIGEDDENGEGVNNKKDLIDANKNRSNNTSRKSGRKRDEKDGYDINDKLSKPRLYKKADQFTVSDYDPSDENYSIYDIEEELDEDEDGDGEHHERGFIETLKKNQRLLNRNYEIAMQNKNTNFVEILFTEIIDKIYITKILFFTRKFDIFWLQLSVYLLCHLLLLVLNTLFYDIDIIKKIWNEENYPGLGYHLGYGFAACLIIWIVYKIFLCLLTNNDKIKDLLKMIHYNDKFGWNKGKEIDRKFKNLMWKVKFKVAIYSIIEFLLIIFAFLYLTVFGSVYTGTQSNTFKTYGIALIEILMIKILYGTALAIMRQVSLSKQKKGLYNVVLFMNTYLV